MASTYERFCCWPWAGMGYTLVIILPLPTLPDKQSTEETCPKLPCARSPKSGLLSARAVFSSTFYRDVTA